MRREAPRLTFNDTVARWQRLLVLALFFGSAVLILPAAVEPFMLPKATLIVAGAVGIGALSAFAAAWSRSVQLPTGAVPGAGAALALALVVSSVTSPQPWTSVTGFYARYTGLVAYLSYLLLFLVVVRIADVPFVRLLSRVSIVALSFVVGYGLLQAAGVEPFGFTDIGLGSTFSFFGNVNFSAAWAAAVSALVLARALDRTEQRAWRIAAALVLPPGLLYVGLTGTSQGLVVALVSLGTVLALAASAEDSQVRRAVAQDRRRTLLLTGAIAAVLLVAAAAALPVLRAQLDQALVERPEFWAAAVDIFLDHPVVGTGLDTYAHHFLAYRPASHALANGAATTDAPHSVPLGMFSNGGLLLGLTYLAFVAVAGVALVRGAFRLHGPARLPFAGAAGLWLGYQTQSLVSFDVPPLALLHFLSAGVLIAMAWPPTWRTIALPGQPVTARRGRKGRAGGTLLVPPATKALLVVVGVAGVVALWFVAYPLRADLLAASASPLTKSGRFGDAVQRFERAAALNPGEASYAYLAAQGLKAAGRQRQAIEAAAEAADRDPGTVQYPLFVARVAREVGDGSTAVRWYSEAVERDPLDPPVLNEAAEFLLASGEVGAARELLERSVRLRPDPVALALLEKVESTEPD